MTRKMRDLTRTGLVVLGAAMALTAASQSASAYWRGCWGCGAYVAPVVVARPYVPPVYYTAPVVVPPVVAPAPVVVPAPVVTYPVCPALPPYPYYCR